MTWNFSFSLNQLNWLIIISRAEFSCLSVYQAIWRIAFQPPADILSLPLSIWSLIWSLAGASFSSNEYLSISPCVWAMLHSIKFALVQSISPEKIPLFPIDVFKRENCTIVTDREKERLKGGSHTSLELDSSQDSDQPEAPLHVFTKTYRLSLMLLLWALI